MTTELPAKYDPAAIEPEITKVWLDHKAFAAAPDDRENRYVVMMPLPNVTGALHMGHAMDNVMQDLLIRWHRMQGDNTLWMAGTDHAGIATQAVVEKRLKEIEGRTRQDIGREALVQRIWEWKEQSQKRIIVQQQAMGCSCDWDRTRFTMDAVCARAVRWTFFKMFRDGLIFRGNRLVNWDCALQTAVADDELYKATVQGKFYYLRYPVIDAAGDEPLHVVVATTRPETMLGDTAVAVHPDPAAAMAAAIDAASVRLAEAKASEQEAVRDELERLQDRVRQVLPHLVQVAAMAKAGRKLRLPLLDREIPLVLDAWADPTLGTGCVKITPAHDPNDYQVWQRHLSIGAINALNPDGTISSIGGKYAGMERFAARAAVMQDLQALGLVEKVEDRDIEIDHSDRSKTIVEPYLSKQWFVRMADVDGGVAMGRGTDKEFRAAGLAQAALDASAGVLPPFADGVARAQLAFHPDQERYCKMYDQWLGEKRDWCISRQLWWGHRIPVWRGEMRSQQLLMLEGVLLQQLQRDDVTAWILFDDGRRLPPQQALQQLREDGAPESVEVQLCFRDDGADQHIGALLQSAGLELDPDVLDTWFSSALWPHSTLGWPDPATAAIDAGQTPLTAGGRSALDYYYPGSCLVTGRDIITLWVARMVITGLYNLGDLPFTDVFLHATILDGKGERMSKSKGNGIDPLDIVHRHGADALRYVVCELQTGTQDIRLPVQAISPFAAEERLIDLATAKPGPYLGTYIDPETKQPFDLVGQYQKEGLPLAKATSERFTIGANFCNKLFNAARFAFLNLEGTGMQPLQLADLPLEDRWILSRLSHAAAAAQAALQSYNPSAAIGSLREFFWSELCDWYLELIKPRCKVAEQAAVAQQVLAAVLDQTLRLLHPFVPFLTEKLWHKLGELAPQRGIEQAFAPSELLVLAAWPVARAAWRDALVERQLATLQQLVTAIREARARYQVPPKDKVPLRIQADGATATTCMVGRELLANMAGCTDVRIGPNQERTADAATVVVGDAKAFLIGVVDLQKEQARLEQQQQKLKAQIDGIEKKLGNAGFVQKAPAEVVQQQRQNLDNLQQQLAAVTQSLRELA